MNHQFYIRTIPQSVEEKKDQGWEFRNLFSASTHIMEKYQGVFGIFNENAIPHPVHQHPEEELILVRSGSLDLIRDNDELLQGQNTYRLLPDTLIYLPAYDPHTFRAAGPGKTAVVVVRWKGVPRKPSQSLLKRSNCDLSSRPPASQSSRSGSSQVHLFDDPTRYTSCLRADHIHIKTGFGYGEHTHPHDLIMILLEGCLDTMHLQIPSPALLLFPAGMHHWAKSTGSSSASLLTFAFS